MKHTLFITGAAGYVGTMLVRHFAAREDVERIIGLDKEPLPELLAGETKLHYLKTNTADDWKEEVARFRPDIVIHAAWDIRAVYGDTQATWRSNIEGSDNVFDFALSESSVKRLVHFSTVASYGSFPSNTIEHRFTEDEPFRKTDYLYAEEKRIAEEHLKARYDARTNKDVDVAIVRPAAITGPRGRFMRIRFGLQSALSGQLEGARIYSLIKALVAFVPVTPKWARQFIHEDDVVGIVERLALGPSAGPYEVFNICPPGEVIRGRDMAEAVGKRVLPVFPWMVRLPFFVFWHASRGKVPTARGSWKGYSYPIVVDGSKVTEKLGYQYRSSGRDAFCYTAGSYESFVPEQARRSKA
ncbi:MAG TPA: NAD-dependent epimerase/dehydratase family protein [Candidatus Paceibacterota bacterium]|nr:NAD-dependent epimerase/dehydratase family protein [Candidatus Paceibacterota bacterium]